MSRVFGVLSVPSNGDLLISSLTETRFFTIPTSQGPDREMGSKLRVCNFVAMSRRSAAEILMEPVSSVEVIRLCSTHSTLRMDRHRRGASCFFKRQAGMQWKGELSAKEGV
jgi:hypothetical protein